jgi:hypothetical protein
MKYSPAITAAATIKHLMKCKQHYHGALVGGPMLAVEPTDRLPNI